MKKFTRILSLLLCFFLILPSFVSCFTLVRSFVGDFDDVTDELQTASADDLQVDSTPDDSTSAFPAYSLTQSDVDDCSAVIAECREMLLNGSAEWTAVEAKVKELEDKFYHIATQEQLAYLFYCQNTSSKTASDHYLFASSAVSNLYQQYNAFCRAVDDSECPCKADFFSDWSQEDLESMRSFSAEQEEYSRKNDELLVSYRSLSDNQFSAGTADLYWQLLKNNNTIAGLYGYDDYWTYAYEKVYDRDFGKTDVDAMRSYVKDELIPLCKSCYSEYKSFYFNVLTLNESRVLDRFLNTALTELSDSENLTVYLSSFPKESQTVMEGLFQPENAVFTSSQTAYAGAFTGYLYEYDRPFCYFGPGYQTQYTIIHEMGHYLAASTEGTSNIALDIAEMQSQGNEWLYTAFLADKLEANIWRALLLLRLTEDLATIIRSTMIDHFEELCYKNTPQTAAELDGIMDAVCSYYEESDFVNFVIKPRDYWRYVVLESPVYYISYAVSMVPVLELFSVAKEDFTAGQSLYLNLIETVGESSTYSDVLTACSLSSPFEAEVYETLGKLLK